MKKCTWILLCACALCNSGCVRHYGHVEISDPSWTVLQDGVEITGNANFESALPAETHVDAWYRDHEGFIHRAHVHLESPKPWWQRFPSDLFTDLLWPTEIRVEASQLLIMKEAIHYDKETLDRLATDAGYGKEYGKEYGNVEPSKIEP